VVPGAGLALLRTIAAVDAEAAKTQGDERAGVQILRRALESPTRQIAENSGVDAGVVVDKMLAGTGNFGFDAATGAYVDLVEAGIIDPTKVVRLALENAASAAGTLLLTEVTMTEVPDRKPETPALDAA
jgi:chaperonin GroEL